MCKAICIISESGSEGVSVFSLSTHTCCIPTPISPATTFLDVLRPGIICLLVDLRPVLLGVVVAPTAICLNDWGLHIACLWNFHIGQSVGCTAFLVVWLYSFDPNFEILNLNLMTHTSAVLQICSVISKILLLMPPPTIGLEPQHCLCPWSIHDLHYWPLVQQVSNFQSFGT